LERQRDKARRSELYKSLGEYGKGNEFGALEAIGRTGQVFKQELSNTAAPKY